MHYIDSHQHFWQLNRGDYDWLTPNLIPLYRNFLPNDLSPTLSDLNIHGTILIQAAPTLNETFFMLQLAKQHPFILGVVGWIDMLSDHAANDLAALIENPLFCGIRPMLQDIPDPDWMLQKKLTPLFKLLETTGKTFDALVLPKHLPNLMRLLDKHPELNVVIDHGAKPAIKSNQLQPWANDMKTIAECPNVYCKFSGLITEANADASFDALIPYIDHLFSTFNYQRIMWGSDFPVLNLASDYRKWFNFCHDYVSRLGTQALEMVFGKVAAEFYL